MVHIIWTSFCRWFCFLKEKVFFFSFFRRDTLYIVAPYEADSQLAYLSKNNLVDAVMTEDSDLFIFGAKNLIVKELVCTKQSILIINYCGVYIKYVTLVSTFKS